MGKVIEPTKTWYLYYTTPEGNTFGITENNFTSTNIEKFRKRLQRYEDYRKSGIVWNYEERK